MRQTRGRKPLQDSWSSQDFLLCAQKFSHTPEQLWSFSNVKIMYDVPSPWHQTHHCFFLKNNLKYYWPPHLLYSQHPLEGADIKTIYSTLMWVIMQTGNVWKINSVNRAAVNISSPGIHHHFRTERVRAPEVGSRREVSRKKCARRQHDTVDSKAGQV